MGLSDLSPFETVNSSFAICRARSVRVGDDSVLGSLAGGCVVVGGSVVVGGCVVTGGCVVVGGSVVIDGSVVDVSEEKQ